MLVDDDEPVGQHLETPGHRPWACRRCAAGPRTVTCGQRTIRAGAAALPVTALERGGGCVEADRGGHGQVERLGPPVDRHADDRVAQARARSSGRPHASLPKTHACGPVEVGVVEGRCRAPSAASTRRPRLAAPSRRRSTGTPVTTGRWKSDPARGADHLGPVDVDAATRRGRRRRRRPRPPPRSTVPALPGSRTSASTHDQSRFAGQARRRGRTTGTPADREQPLRRLGVGTSPRARVGRGARTGGRQPGAPRAASTMSGCRPAAPRGDVDVAHPGAAGGAPPRGPPADPRRRTGRCGHAPSAAASARDRADPVGDRGVGPAQRLPVQADVSGQPPAGGIRRRRRRGPAGPGRWPGRSRPARRRPPRR